MENSEYFTKRFNHAVETFNSKIGNIFYKIEAGYDPYYEYEQIEVAIDSNNDLVIGGKKTILSVYDVVDIDCHFKTMYSPFNKTDIWNHYGSYIRILFSNGDDIRLVYDSEYDDCLQLRDDLGQYISGSIDLAIFIDGNTHQYELGMSRETFIEEYNTVIDLFNEHSCNYFFESLVDESENEDEELYFELAIDENDKLIVLGRNTKIFVHEIKRICYKVHSQIMESYIRFVLLNDNSFIILVRGGDIQEIAYMPDEDFYS